MRLLVLAPTALSLLLLGSCGSTAAPGATRVASNGPAACFSPDRISNFASSDDTTLNIKASDRKVFQLHTTGGCFDLGSANQLAVRSFTGSSRLCTGDTAEITTPGAVGGPQTCRATVVGTLTDEQVAALPSRARP